VTQPQRILNRGQHLDWRGMLATDLALAAERLTTFHRERAKLPGQRNEISFQVGENDPGFKVKEGEG